MLCENCGREINYHATFCSHCGAKQDRPAMPTYPTEPVAPITPAGTVLQDYSENPRTIVLSSHLIDEIAHLLEHVVVIDQGKIMVDESAEDLHGRAVTLVGRADAVQQVVGNREVLDREELGRIVRTTVLGRLTADERRLVSELDLDVIPVSLQQLIVHMTRNNALGQAESEGF